jgi:lisH domain-containing protein FOPNL
MTTFCIVLKENLETSGALREIKARLQEELFKELEDKSENKPPLNNENVLLNELILEYLMYNGYSVAASVLITESGHPKGLLGRKFLQNELKIVPPRGSDL